MVYIPLEDMKKAIQSLSLNDKAELMHTLADAIKDADKPKESDDERKAKRLAALHEFAGSATGLWRGIDAVEYQRSLREDRIIG